MHFRARELELGERKRGFRLLERRLCDSLLRARVLKVFFRGYTPGKQRLIARAVELRVFEIGGGLRRSRFGLLELVAERRIIEPGNEFSRVHVVPFGDLQLGDAPRNERADAHILVRKRRNRAAHSNCAANVGLCNARHGHVCYRIGRGLHILVSVGRRLVRAGWQRERHQEWQAESNAGKSLR